MRRGQGSCCNLMDCRPTQSRMVGDHYEVKVDGEWMPVPNDKINNVVAPDGGAHVSFAIPRVGGEANGRWQPSEAIESPTMATQLLACKKSIKVTGSLSALSGGNC